MTAIMNKATELRAVLNPQRLPWENNLRAPVVAVVGWMMGVEDGEAGVPDNVAIPLAGALSQHFQVIFGDGSLAPRAEEWELGPKGLSVAVKPPLWRRLTGWSPVTLTSGRDPARIVDLFDAATFHWTQQTQFGLLLPPSANLPVMSYELAESMLSRETVDLSSLASRIGAQGLLRPGPDGDFAVLGFLDSAAWQRFADALEVECAKAGVSFRIVDEAAFVSTRWRARASGPALQSTP
jgi:hypothetical protein